MQEDKASLHHAHEELKVVQPQPMNLDEFASSEKNFV